MEGEHSELHVPASLLILMDSLMAWVLELHPSNLDRINRLPKHRSTILFCTFYTFTKPSQLRSAVPRVIA
jgi:hypothetical protein